MASTGAFVLDRRAAPLPPPSADEAAASDDPQAEFTAYTDLGDGRRVAASQLQLSGLWCAACAGAIEQLLLAEPGVGAARVSYATQRAEVRWDPAATRLSRLVAAVRRAGYGAVADAAAPARALRRAEERGALWRLFVAVFCMMQVMMYQAPVYFAAPGTLTPDLRSLLLWAAWLLSVPVVLFSAAPLFGDAWRGLRRSRISMDLPVAIGIAITFVVSSAATFDPHGPFGADVYFDSLTMFVGFLLGGRYVALRMRNRVAATLEEAVSRTPATARRVEADGSVSCIPAHRLRPGDRVRVLAGEAFGADGPIVDGATEVDESLLTGESVPVAKRAGDEAIAGSINLRGSVVQRADRVGADTRYAAIVALMRGALTDRPAMLRAADRVAAPFLWAVLGLAAAAAAAWSTIDPSRAVWVAVSVLIVTCPCALSLAAPSALLAAAGALARRGVLVQRLDAIEALARVDRICFDKTGTLTDARPRLDRTTLLPAARRAGLDAAALHALAASLAGLSLHPLARALAAAAPDAGGAAPRAWTNPSEHAGLGIEAWTPDGARYRLGTGAWADAAPDAPGTPASGASGDPRGAPAPTEAGPGGAACDTVRRPGDVDRGSGPHTVLGGPGGALARFDFGESLRPAARATVEALQRDGLVVALLSGDAAGRVREVASRLGIDRWRGDATPAAKLDEVAQLQAAGHRVAMVGDGINDAPVMARADVSVAIGQGADLTRAKADIVLMSGALADLAWARGTARRAVRVVHQNIGWALAYNATAVPLALAGLLPAWAAGLGMAGSSLVVILNALRIERAARRGPVGAAAPRGA